MPTATKEKSEQKTTAGQMQEFLASVYTLYVKTQNFHWNVTGPLFPQLHEMFDRQYKELAAEIDEVAEQIRAMGYFVPASLVAFEQISKISDDESGPLPARKMVQILTDDHEAVAKQGNELISALDDADDPATADMVTDAVKRHQKNAWMLRSSQDASK